MLVGRESECAAIDDLITRSRSGNGGSLVLRGEPGIGKSALLDYAGRREDLLVLRTVGVQPEVDLGYATLHRLLLPVLNRVGELPGPQASAIGVVLGLEEGVAPDQFLVALAALSLLSLAAAEGPVLCCVDDAHWVDPASLTVLEFVGRRLGAESVALLMVVRQGEGRLMPGLEDVQVTGLEPTAIAALMAERGVTVSGVHLDQLTRATGGNPLALLSTPIAALSGPEVSWGGPVPITDELQQIFRRRAEEHPLETRRLLLLVAADGSRQLEVVRRAADQSGLDPGLLGAAGLDDLIVVESGVVAFRHPLIRSAVYQGASQPERSEAHAALAAALASEPAELQRRAWHLGQAADGIDADAADLLEQSAQQTQTRGGAAAAAAALERSAQLTGPGQVRLRRLITAAGAWWDGGDDVRATGLLDRVDQLLRADTPPENDHESLAEASRIDALMLRAMIELRSGSPRAAVSLLGPLTAEVPTDDLPRTIRLLMLYGEAGYQADEGRVWDELSALVERMDRGARTAENAPRPDEPYDEMAELFRATMRARTVRRGSDGPGENPTDPDDLAWVDRLDDPALMCWVAGLAWGVGRQDVGRGLRKRAVEVARDRGAIGTLAWVQEYLVGAELNEGRLKTAELHAEEGARYAQETGQLSLSCRHRGMLALVLALQGREEARGLAAESLAESSERDLARVTAQGYQALGLLELAAGRPDTALEHFLATDRGAAGHPGVAMQATPDRVEAAVRAGRPEEAHQAYASYVRWADRTGAPGPAGIAARCAGLLAEGSESELHYRRSIALHDEADQPFERARTELLLGEQLRRERRQIDARPSLRSAWQIFLRLGAEGWALRAERELRAAGESVQGHGGPSVDSLTHQEQRIVAGVAEGATNKEIAAHLFLSPRTIDYHLRKVFQKLGLRSRSELVRLSVEREERPMR